MILNPEYEMIALETADYDAVYNLVEKAGYYIEDVLGTKFYAETYEEFSAEFYSHYELAAFPFAKLNFIHYFDLNNQEQNYTHWTVERVSYDKTFLYINQPVQTFDRIDAVTISYTVGLNDIPLDIKRAARLLIEAWHKGTDVPPEVDKLLSRIDQRLYPPDPAAFIFRKKHT